MLRGYLSEAVSLLAEAVLGKPTPARAEECWFTGRICAEQCNSCGAEKRRWNREYCCTSGYCRCDYFFTCTYC